MLLLLRGFWELILSFPCYKSIGAMKGKKIKYKENPNKHVIKYLPYDFDFLLFPTQTSEFPNIFDVNYFKVVLANEVHVVLLLP